MKLKIMIPEKLVIERDVDSVTLPGASGELTIMSGHDFLTTPLNAGRLYFRGNDDGGKPSREDYSIGPGCLEVTKDAARVFVATAEKA